MKNLLNASLIDGLEALTITERMKIFFTDMSTGIDAVNASVFNSSIHTVQAAGVIKKLKDNSNYFDYSSNQIPTPVFFNPEKTTFREYVSFCVASLGLLGLAESECERLYDAFKRIAAKGEVPFKIRHWDMQKAVDDAKANMDKHFFSSNLTTRAMNQVYKNVNEMDDTFNYFNSVVKNLKSRDVEIMGKKVDNFIDIVKLIKKKIDIGDLKFNAEDNMTMELAIQRLSELVSTSGLIMGRLNELTRVLELQAAEFKRYVV